MHIARYKVDPNFRERGLNGGPRLVAFVSEDAHYSFLKTAILLGIGTDNLVKVPTNKNGSMSLLNLKTMIEKVI